MSDNLRHTPGPWQHGFGSPARPYVIAITRDPLPSGILDQRYTVTAGEPTGGGPFFRGTRYDQMEADARLIASAPDLVATVRAVYGRLAAYGAAKDVPIGLRMCFQECANDLRAVHARATGEEPR